MSILREELITNHLLLDYFDLWDEFDIKSANDTKEVRYYNLLMNLIESQLDAGIRWLDSKEAEEYFKEESKYQQELSHVSMCFLPMHCRWYIRLNKETQALLLGSRLIWCYQHYLL